MEKTFIGAMVDYFGRLPGQSLTDFQKELAQLTPMDRLYFQHGLETVGYKIVKAAA